MKPQYRFFGAGRGNPVGQSRALRRPYSGFQAPVTSPAPSSEKLIPCSRVGNAAPVRDFGEEHAKRRQHDDWAVQKVREKRSWRRGRSVSQQRAGRRVGLAPERIGRAMAGRTGRADGPPGRAASCVKGKSPDEKPGLSISSGAVCFARNGRCICTANCLTLV
jgi:hypothetical protein